VRHYFVKDLGCYPGSGKFFIPDSRNFSSLPLLKEEYEITVSEAHLKRSPVY
jgi:hypothetical protein